MYHVFCAVQIIKFYCSIHSGERALQLRAAYHCSSKTKILARKSKKKRNWWRMKRKSAQADHAFFS